MEDSTLATRSRVSFSSSVSSLYCCTRLEFASFVESGWIGIKARDGEGGNDGMGGGWDGMGHARGIDKGGWPKYTRFLGCWDLLARLSVSRDGLVGVWRVL